MTPQGAPLTNNIYIKCPKCGKVLQFKAFPNYKKARLKCPFCEYDDLIENYNTMQMKTSTPPTKPTVPMSPPPMTHQSTIVNLRCIDNGQVRSLQMGDNSIGRSSITPQASVTFDDNQRYLGRNHAKITIIRSPQGTIQCRLSDNGSKNGTFIGKNRINPGTIVVIPAGQEFSLARLRFVIDIEGNNAPQNNGETNLGQTMIL